MLNLILCIFIGFGLGTSSLDLFFKHFHNSLSISTKNQIFRPSCIFSRRLIANFSKTHLHFLAVDHSVLFYWFSLIDQIQDGGKRHEYFGSNVNRTGYHQLQWMLHRQMWPTSADGCGIRLVFKFPVCNHHILRSLQQVWTGLSTTT